MTSSKSETAKQKDSRPLWRRVGRRTIWTLLTIVLVLVAVRLAMPYAIKSYVNRQLDKVPDYGGRIGDVDVHLYRGAYQIHDIKIVKTTGDVPVPFFAAKTVDLSMEWKELFHGALAGEIILQEPQLNFVAGPTEEASQNGKDRNWGKTLESLFPFKINRFEIQKGEVHFRNFHSTPVLDISLGNLYAVATNLTNTRDLTEKLPAGLTARAATLNSGELNVRLKMNPLADVPTFELNAELTNANLLTLNDFLRAYGKFDVERGTLSLFTSVATTDGSYDGYVKVLFTDLDVFAWEKERKKNILEVFWQAVVGTTATLFKNQPKDQLATKIPLSGTFAKSQVGVWTAVGTLLENAFIRALLPKLDKTVKVEEVREKVEPTSPSDKPEPPPK